MTKRVGMVNFIGQMVELTKGNGCRGSNMEREYILMLRVKREKEYGQRERERNGWRILLILTYAMLMQLNMNMIMSIDNYEIRLKMEYCDIKQLE